MKKALAFLFQREGSEISKEDFVYAQSVDLEWFSSDEARKLIDKALEAGLVDVDENIIKANFEYGQIDIPIGFEPSKNILEGKSKDIFSEILDEMVEKSSLSKQQIMSKVNEVQDKLEIEIITAMLLVARKNDISIDELDRKIEEVTMKLRGR